MQLTAVEQELYQERKYSEGLSRQIKEANVERNRAHEDSAQNQLLVRARGWRIRPSDDND